MLLKQKTLFKLAIENHLFNNKVYSSNLNYYVVRHFLGRFRLCMLILFIRNLFLQAQVNLRLKMNNKC